MDLPDSSPPLRESGLPDAVLPAGTTASQLSLNTDEIATCKFSDVGGLDFSLIPNTFTTTGGTEHLASISGLTDSTEYNYFIRCVDELGNVNANDLIILFSVGDVPVPNPESVIEITNMVTSSGKLYDWDTLGGGKLLYTDRSFTFSTVPLKYDGLLYIKTANDDAAVKADPMLVFDVNRDVTVYVAYDSRGPLPSWINGWSDTGDNIGTTDVSRQVFEKNFVAGSVSLGPNAAGSMYSVILGLAGSIPSIECGDGTCSEIERLDASFCSADCKLVTGIADHNFDEFRLRVADSENVDRWFSTKLPVLFIERTTSGADVERVRFDHFFDLSRILNLNLWKLRRQAATDTRGFILVKGPDLLGDRKSVLVDRIANANFVCIKDAPINDISEVSGNCGGSSEFLLACDGAASTDGYRCTIQGNLFNVTGMRHSAVVEYIGDI